MQQRSLATQRRVLEAAVECLVERGWSGTTTTLDAEGGAGRVAGPAGGRRRAWRRPS